MTRLLLYCGLIIIFSCNSAKQQFINNCTNFSTDITKSCKTDKTQLAAFFSKNRSIYYLGSSEENHYFSIYLSNTTKKHLLVHIPKQDCKIKLEFTFKEEHIGTLKHPILIKNL